MPAKSLATLAADFFAAADLDVALRLLNDEFGDKYLTIALLEYDGRRSTLKGRGPKTPPGGTERALMALDHIPAQARFTLLAGQRFADLGDQGSQYANVLGISADSGTARLYIKGIVLDGALTAVLAVHDPRGRGAKTIERIEPGVALFELAYARLFERDARLEAVDALHDITSRMRSEHAAAIAELERELARLRAARGAADGRLIDDVERELAAALQRAETAEQRLTAVEHQVTSAVDRLERAHIQLHQQAETLREQADTIAQLEQRLASSTAHGARADDVGRHRVQDG